MRTMVALVGLVVGCGSMNSQAASELVVNGGFESGDFSNWNYTSLDGFSFVDTGFAHSGSYAAFFGDLQQDGGGSISQSLATVANATYVLSFWFAGDGDIPSGFSAIVGGNTLYQVTNPPFDVNYNLHTFDFTATSSVTLLEFTAYDNASYINLDDVSVVPFVSGSVPEPTSMIPLGIGLVAITGYTWYRRKVAK